MRKLKKLTLKKETIANLSENEMKNVVGGYYTGLPLTCWICGTTGQPPGGGTYNCPSEACTRPPRCCDHGCCETLGC